MNRQSIRVSARYSFVLFIAIGFTSFGCRDSSAASSSGGAESSASAASRGSSHSGATRVSWSGTKRVAIADPQRGINAATLEIPVGWKFAGRIVSIPGCHGLANSFDFTAQGQDGVTALIRLPGAKWNVTQPAVSTRFHMRPPCPFIDITTPADFLTKIAVPNMHPGAKIEAVLPLEAEYQASVAKQLEQARQMLSRFPPAFRPTSQTLDGARVRIQYVRNGQPVEEMLSVVVACQTSQLMGEICNAGGGISVVRAPKGQLDAVLAQTAVKSMRKSFQGNPEWGQRINQEMQAQGQELQAKEQRDAAAEQNQFNTNMRNNQQQFNQQIANDRAQDAQRAQGTANAMAADRARQAAIDQSAHNTVNYSLDRRDYINPNTGQTITTSNQYSHQWVDSTNDTIVQTDGNFDPNGSVNPVSEGWVEMDPK